MLLTKKSHLTKEFTRIEIANHHFLPWVFDIVDYHRDRTIQDEVEVLTGFALTEYGRPRFHRESLAMLEERVSIGNTLTH